VRLAVAHPRFCSCVALAVAFARGSRANYPSFVGSHPYSTRAFTQASAMRLPLDRTSSFRAYLVMRGWGSAGWRDARAAPRLTQLM